MQRHNLIILTSKKNTISGSGIAKAGRKYEQNTAEEENSLRKQDVQKTGADR